MISHLKAAAIKELKKKKKQQNGFKEAQPVFKGIFKVDIVHVCSEPRHDRCKDYDF